MFAIPWEDQTLVGTTDTDYDARPEDVAADADDVRYLLDAVNAYFPGGAARANPTSSAPTPASGRWWRRPPANRKRRPRPRARRRSSRAPRACSRSAAGSSRPTVGSPRRWSIASWSACGCSIPSGASPSAGRARCRSRARASTIPTAADFAASPSVCARARRPASTMGSCAICCGATASAALRLIERFTRRAGRGAPLVVADLPYRRIEITRAAEGEMAETLDDVLRRRVPISFRHADGGPASGRTSAR